MQRSTQVKVPLPSGHMSDYVSDLLRRDEQLARAVLEVDRGLVELAMARTLRERLRAGTAMARLSARFRR